MPQGGDRQLHDEAGAGVGFGTLGADLAFAAALGAISIPLFAKLEIA